MKKIMINIFIFVMIISCGKQTKNDTLKNINIANLYINSKEYEKAISILENEIKKDPNNKELKIKLAHAYAGASGFEVFKFSKLLTNANMGNVMLNNIVNAINLIISKVEHLNTPQKRRLAQAINTYSETGENPYTSSKKINFKWGVLYAYRFFSNLKEVKMFYDDILNDKEYLNYEIQEKIIFHGDKLAKDFYKCYLLFKNSFYKLEKVSWRFEDLLRRLVRFKDFHLKIKSKALDYKGFVLDLIKENKKGILKIFNKILNDIDPNNMRDTIKLIAIKLKNKKTSSSNLKFDELFWRELNHAVIKALDNISFQELIYFLERYQKLSLVNN